MESPTVNLCARSRWMVTAGDRDLSSLPTAEARAWVMLETVRTLNVEPPLWMDAGHCDGRSRKSRARGGHLGPGNFGSSSIRRMIELL